MYFVYLRIYCCCVSFYFFAVLMGGEKVGRNERINYAKGLLQREFLPHVGIGAGTEAKKVRRPTDDQGGPQTAAVRACGVLLLFAVSWRKLDRILDRRPPLPCRGVSTYLPPTFCCRSPHLLSSHLTSHPAIRSSETTYQREKFACCSLESR